MYDAVTGARGSNIAAGEASSVGWVQGKVLYQIL